MPHTWEERPLSHPATPRAGMGVVLRELLLFLDARGLTGPVAERVSPATRALMQKPPWALAWVPAQPIDEIESAVQALLGREGCVELGLTLARRMGGALLQPLLRTALSLFGSKPETVFANLDRFFSLSTRGIAFEWQPADARGGVVKVVLAGGDLPQAPLHVLQGTLQYAFELTGGKGSVGEVQILANGRSETTAAYRVVLEA
ncbi:MAG: hypothetical protein NVS2B9_07670 [Myxococcales bacterium]